MRPVVKLDAHGEPILVYRPPTLAEVDWWQDHVQASQAALHPQACNGWTWRREAFRCANFRVGGWRAAYRWLSASAHDIWGFPYEILAVFHTAGPRRPLAMATYLPETVGLRPNSPKALYLEFIMAQPRAMHGHTSADGFGAYLMDRLVLESQARGLGGRICLHAAAGSLCGKYEAWGFTRIGRDVPLPWPRENNGLFYELLPREALAFNARFHQLR